ncbi:MAG: glycosyltransferase family 4 protein [Candidatus Parcubacteria bacterium]|nr:glycosyltransferase family 4 protein [Burkholderiales bacterium]
MRVALVRQRYNPFGGAERFIERALPALERAGAEVTLIARSWQSPAAGWEARQVLFADPPYAGNLWRDRSFARAARKLWERCGFDLVQSHERIAGCDVYRAGDGVHAQWLEIRRAAAGPLERLGIALNPYHRYVCDEERRMFQHPQLRAVICNSQMVRDEIGRRFELAPEKLHLVYNGVDLEHFHPRLRASLRAAARAELGVAPAETMFLFVGSGFARKGLDAAIVALASCGNMPYRLVVAGRDRHAARFAALAAASGLGERVQLVGGRDDVRPLYAAADCFILPTRYDPFPNTVLEALAMGLPAIVGRRSGAAESLRHGEIGWICEPEDPAGLAQLMHAAADAARAGGASSACRAAAECFGMDDMARKLVDLYAALGSSAQAR